MTREKKMQFPANRDGRPSPHRGRVAGPDALGGKACWAYTSTVPVERSGIRAAHRGLDAPVRRHPFRRLKSHWSTPKIPGILTSKFFGVTTGWYLWAYRTLPELSNAQKRLLGALPTHPTTHTRPLARMQHGPPRLSSHCAAACDGRACGVHRKSRMAHESLSYALTRVSVRACTHGRATSCASDAAACSAGGGLSRRRRARRRAALMELKR